MKNIIIAKSILDAIDTGASLFKRGGVKLHAAATSEHMLDLHRRIKADLIIADYSQPVMNGVKLCSAIRAEPGLKDVSIIVACDNSAVFQAACRDAGANAVITKPVDPFDLFSKVADLIIIQQRKDMRVLLRVSVSDREQSASFMATSYNISMSGMLLEANRELKRGDSLTCMFNLAHTEVIAECVVTRVTRADSGRYRFGVKFVNLDTKAIVVIEQYVKSKLKE